MKRIAIFLAISAMAPLALLAQETAQPAPQPVSQKAPAHYYKLNLTVKETNDSGQVTNARSYVTTVMAEGPMQSVRTGTRIPILTAVTLPNVPAQFQYIDLGVNFDVRDVEEMGNRLGLKLRADVASVGEQQNIGNYKEPVIRDNKWDSAVVIPIGKPVVVFSSDDLNDKGKMQVELTATKLD